MMDGEPVRLMPDPPVRGLTLYRIRPSGGRVFAKHLLSSEFCYDWARLEWMCGVGQSLALEWY